MKHTTSALLIALFWVTAAQATTSRPVTAKEKKHLIAGIDNLCKCTGLQRKSGLKVAEHYREPGDERYNVTALMAADGVTAEYEFWFGADDRYPLHLWQKGYTTQVAKGTGADTLKSASDRRFCLEVIEYMDQCKPRWQHFGKAMIQKDGRRGFRISFLSIPKREIDRAFKTGNVLSVMDPYVNFSVSRKGTVYGITEGG
jgi:hypothetical protein